MRNGTKKWIGMVVSLAMFVSLWVAIPMTVHAAGELILKQTNLGNIFLNTETVNIPVDSTGTHVSWNVTDYWGNQIKTGSTPVVNGTANVQPNLGKVGYFEIELTAWNGGQWLAKKKTSFAVVRDNSGVNASDTRFGVQTHFAQGWNTDILPLIAKAGIKVVRDEFYWKLVETTQGVYNYSQFDPWVNQLVSNNMKVLAIMSYGNPLYDEGYPPYSDAGRSAYANYGKSILQQYGSTIKALEVWNEYNGGGGPSGPASADSDFYYTQMLKKVYEVIKPAYPNTPIIGGGLVHYGAGFAEGMFQNDALSYMDAFSYHTYDGYQMKDPDSILFEAPYLKERIQFYNGGNLKPIYVTEFGNTYNNNIKYNTSSIARSATSMLGEGYQQVDLYVAMDESWGFPGMLRAGNSPYGKYAPNPSYAAYSNMIHQLYGAETQGRQFVSSASNAVMYKFTKGGNEVRAAWSGSNQMEDINLLTNSSVTIVDVMGESTTVSPVNGKIFIDLSVNPVYIISSPGSVSGVEAATTPSPIANSVMQFGDTQGQDGWYYGYFNVPSTGYTFQPMTWKATYWDWAWVGPVDNNKLTVGGGAPALDSATDIWAVRRWKSDRTGTITVRGTYGNYNSKNFYNKRDIHILKNGTIIKSFNADGIQRDYEHTFQVSVNDNIDFAISYGPTGEDKNGYTINIYDTASIPAPSYNVLNDFTYTQGWNQWSYEQWYQNAWSYMTRSGDYMKGTEYYTLVRPTSMLADVNSDSAVVWNALKDGTINISGNVHKVNINEGDGTLVKIMHNQTQIWPASGWQTLAFNDSTGYTYDLNVNVALGDKIRFIVNVNTTPLGDDTRFNPTITYGGIPIVAKPTFSPPSGTYSSAQSVTISSATSGVEIRYTTDGSTPTASSTLYTGAINVATTQTIKAIAIKSGMTNSDVAASTYTITGSTGNTIPQSQMTATASSRQPGTPPSNVLDGYNHTFWDSQYSPSLPLPQWITLDLGGTYNVNKLRYMPRQDTNTNGQILTYNVYVSSDNVNFTKVVDNGSWANDKTEKTASFSAVSATHVRLEALTSVYLNANVAELNVEY
jgi:hypothetical protein